MDVENLATVIECAELAPSVHNTQPWSCTVTDDGVEIRADRDRGLAVLDPRGRQLIISCGAAVEFAYVAARGLGWECTPHLLPDPDDPDLIARLDVGVPRVIDPADEALLAAIPRRYTDRGSYECTPVSADLFDRLFRGVAERGAWLRALNHDGDRLAVIQALSDAEAAEAADPAYRKELADWMRAGPDVDGVPPCALGDGSDIAVVNDVPRRDFSGANQHRRPGGEDAAPPVERDTLLMIGTDDDMTLSWVQSGRALGWLLLTLTVAGLSSQPLGQAMDIEGTRVRLAHEMGLIGHVQFLLRTGEGHGQPTTGRRHATVS
jgi:hypothetical protein